MEPCVFCEIAAHRLDAVRICEDDELMAFLDRSPIRPGHLQLITKAHVPTFEQLPPRLAARLMEYGQQLARRMKTVFGVERVAFAFTGGDVAHVHAHVIPMHEKTDITSARHILAPVDVQWGSEHLLADREALERVRDELAFVPESL